MSLPARPVDLHAAAAPEPWYRHRWPWLLIAGPAIVVVAGFVTLWLAIRSDDGLVADDYYKQGLGINRTLARAERAHDLGIAVELTIAPDGTLDARIDGRGPLAAPSEVRVSLLRPASSEGDLAAILTRGDDGRYTGRLLGLTPGRWQIVVETEAWRLPSVDVTEPLGRITLRPAPKGP